MKLPDTYRETSFAPGVVRVSPEEYWALKKAIGRQKKTEHELRQIFGEGAIRLFDGDFGQSSGELTAFKPGDDDRHMLVNIIDAELSSLGAKDPSAFFQVGQTIGEYLGILKGFEAKIAPTIN